MSRQQVVDSALAVMGREGFAALSLRGLARELGINHATLYNYFSNIAEVETAALDALMARIPMPDSKRPEPIRIQLLEHLLAVRDTQLVHPNFCLAPSGTQAWRLHMKAVAQAIDTCATSDDQIEDVAIAYNALISVVANHAERSRIAGGKPSLPSDLAALAKLPRDEFEPLFRPLKRNGTYARQLTGFVYRLDHLINQLMPQVASVPVKALEHMQVEFDNATARKDT